MVTITGSAVTTMVKFICARERHRVAKEAGRAVDRPDPVISKYRFCNINRNDDRVTKWIHDKFFNLWRDNPDLWFALVVARLFNLPKTLDPSGGIARFILPFRPEPMRGHLKNMKEAGNIFNAAYIVSTNGKSMDKVDYLIDLVLKPLWSSRKNIALITGQNSLEDVHELLMTFDGLGSFMAAQVVADLKYAHPAQWHDFHSFAASGPGSKRGLNRLCGRALDEPWNELLFRQTLLTLRDKVNARLKWPDPITAQNIQNSLCEADKWLRAYEGGRPKQLYAPKEN